MKKGLKEKYTIRKADGSLCSGRYFVLKIDSKDLDHAAASREALKAYAARIRIRLPLLADDIDISVRTYERCGDWREWDRLMRA